MEKENKSSSLVAMKYMFSEIFLQKRVLLTQGLPWDSVLTLSYTHMCLIQSELDIKLKGPLPRVPTPLERL